MKSTNKLRSAGKLLLPMTLLTSCGVFKSLQNQGNTNTWFATNCYFTSNQVADTLGMSAGKIVDITKAKDPSLVRYNRQTNALDTIAPQGVDDMIDCIGTQKSNILSCAYVQAILDDFQDTVRVKPHEQFYELQRTYARFKAEIRLHRWVNRKIESDEEYDASDAYAQGDTLYLYFGRKLLSEIEDLILKADYDEYGSRLDNVEKAYPMALYAGTDPNFFVDYFSNGPYYLPYDVVRDKAIPGLDLVHANLITNEFGFVNSVGEYRESDTLLYLANHPKVPNEVRAKTLERHIKMHQKTLQDLQNTKQKVEEYRDQYLKSHDCADYSSFIAFLNSEIKRYQEAYELIQAIQFPSFDMVATSQDATSDCFSINGNIINSNDCADGLYDISIVNSGGKQIYSTVIRQSFDIANIGKVPSGIYMAHITGGPDGSYNQTIKISL